MLAWLIDEKKNLRIRYPIICPEDILYWPDDYYERMEVWWSKPDNRTKDPIVVIHQRIADTYAIADGWHRFAISHKLGIKEVPVFVEITM